MGDTTVSRHALGGLLRRLRPTRRVRAEKDARSDGDEEITAPAVADSPTSYRTFSRKLAPSLTALGGVLVLAGGLGQWVRATKLEAEGLAIEEVGSVWGYEDWPGIGLAVLGALAVAAAATWLMSLRVVKLLPVFYTAAIIGLVVWQLPLIDEEAARLATAAREQLDFVTFHSGYGWGAWLMVTGSILLFLGCTAGILREVDVRRGVPG
jgi:hypothetical protein